MFGNEILRKVFLNIAMLLSENENAKRLKNKVLNIVIDTLNQKIGGTTKYINQGDEEFLVAITREPIYRKEFTNAFYPLLFG